MADQAAQLAQMSPAQLSQMPSAPPPPNTPLNFNGRNQLGESTTAVTSLFMALAFVIVGIRAYTKVKVYGKGTWDDLTCALGLICTFIYWVLFLLQLINEGFGRHLWNVPLIITTSDTFFKLAYVTSWFHGFAFIFVKATFFLFYWQIFKPFRWMKLGILSGAILCTVTYLAMTLAALIGSTPAPDQSWLEKTADNTIGKRLSIPLASWTLASDLYILVLPISGVLQLQLSRKKKIGLVGVFATGLGACVCSSLSLYYRTLLNDNDVTWSVVRIQILIIVELCVGIYITCVPMMSVFLRQVAPHPHHFSTFRSKLSYYTSKLRSSLSSHHSSKVSQSTQSSDTSPSSTKKGRIDGPYLNLEHKQLPLQSRVVGGPDAATGLEGRETRVQAMEMGDVPKPFERFEDDRIHLRVDLEQGWSNSQGRPKP